MMESIDEIIHCMIMPYFVCKTLTIKLMNRNQVIHEVEDHHLLYTLVLTV